MSSFIMIALAGGFGAVCRAVMIKILQVFKALPIAIIVINAIATFSIIILSACPLSAELRLVLLAGFLGGFSTLSSVCSDVYGLFINKAYLKSIIYLISMVLLSYCALIAAVLMLESYD